MNLIVAYDSLFGIGKNGDLLWSKNENCTVTDDLVRFKTLTRNHIVVMGNNTWNSIGSKPLPNRINIIFTLNKNRDDNENCYFVSSLSEFNCLLKTLKKCQVFIIGGRDIYTLFIPICQKAYITNFYASYDNAQVYFPQHLFELYFSCDESQTVESEFGKFTVWNRCTGNDSNRQDNIHNDKFCNESGYLRHLNFILRNGTLRQDRTNTGTISIFGCNPIRFDISKCVPLLTTKKMGWKGIIKELLWFLRGDTDAKILQRQNVHIWDQNTSRENLDKIGLTQYTEGILGPGYGWSWRHYGGNYNQAFADSSTITDQVKSFGFDQIKYVENLLRTDPFSRRIYMTGWNPEVLDKVALPPCHVSAQFYVSERTIENETESGIVCETVLDLSCHVYMRSNDTFLGCPYNIFSYTVLVYILALKCNMTPKELIISFGDAHIYLNHIDQIKIQLDRNILNPPRLNLSTDIKTKDYFDISVNDFELVDYQSHDSLNASMSA